MPQSHLRPVGSGMLVLDYGSQYTLLIARKLRELGIYAEIVDGHRETAPSDFHPYGVILSGGPDSVGAVNARSLPKWLWDLNLPILGICYGMQLLIEHFGGKVAPGEQREYGQAKLHLVPSNQERNHNLVQQLKQDQIVWMSHGDTAIDMGPFQVLGSTSSGVPALVGHDSLPIFGAQFHPEVHHSENGKNFLAAFAKNICSAPENWAHDERLRATLAYVRETVGDGRVLMAVSGGVDSTVAVKLLTKALGPERVTAVFIDNGLLRKGEAEQVIASYKNLGIQQLEVIDDSQNFLGKLAGITDPEQKRHIIGHQFVATFEAFASNHQDEFSHLGQGTLYPDVIESAGHGSGAKVIKSHHNVGGLPESFGFELVEPFRYLFKDEVRQIGLDLEIPPEMVFRHPFPGPGLAVRILGAIDTEKLAILREADDVFITRLKQFGHYDSIWQAFVVLLPVKTVGVMGDNRTYQWTAVLRAVTATDGMTAQAGDLPMSFLLDTADAIIRNVDGINRVTYDLTSKPPGTIEWE